jgi:hypothetical protein
MPSFDVTAPNGQIFRVDAPEGASQDDAISYVASSVYPQFLEANKPKPERGIGQLFTEGVKRGTAQTGVLLGDYLPAIGGRGVQAAAEAFGAEGLAKSAGSYAEGQLREASQSELDIAKKYPRAYQSYEDITGPLSAARYAVEAFGEGLPSIVPGLVTGGVGAVAARALPVAARAAATFGATAAGSAAQTVPEAYASLLRETGKEEIGTALVAGGINAALESILPASVISKMTTPAKGALVNSIKARLGVGFVEGAILEGLTEGAQEAVNKAAVSFVDQNKEFFTSDNWKQILDSAIRGAIVGGPVSGVTNVLAGGPQPEAPPVVPVAPEPEVQGPPELQGPPEVSGPPTPVQGPPELQGPPEAQGPMPPVQGPPELQGPSPPVQGPPELQGPPTPVQGPPELQGPPEVSGPPAPIEPPIAAAPPIEPAPIAATPPIEPAPIEPPPAAPLSPVDLPVFKLPKPLAGASPFYGYGSAQFKPVFDNDVDKALYIVGNPKKPSAKDAEYRGFLRNIGFTDPEITDFGSRIRDHIKGLAKTAVGSGQKGGPLTVDYLRTAEPQTYGDIVSRQSPGKPAPIGGALPPAVPGSPESYVTPPGTIFSITPTNTAELDNVIPGMSEVLKAAHARLFPGTRFEYQSNPTMNAYGMLTVYPNSSRPYQFQMNLNAIERDFGKGTEGQKAFVLKTLFHELSHAVEYTWLANAPAKTKADVLAQYVRERNPDSAERFALLGALYKPSVLSDPDARQQILKKMGLTEAQYKKFLSSKAKVTPSKGENAPPKGTVEKNYQRSLSEWVAERGARWFVKELEGAVPKTTFEKFQKTVLDNLRRVYTEVSRILGINPTEGAFENLLREVYGKKTSTPTPRNVFTGSKFPQVILPSRIEGASGITNLSADTQQVPTELRSLPPAMQDYAGIVRRGEDNTIKGWFNGLMRNLAGAEQGETLGKAFLRNSVLSNLPFLERADTKNLGRFLESHQNATGRVMGAVTIGPLGYNPDTKTFFYHNTPADRSLLKIFEKIGTARMDQAQLVMLAQRELALRQQKQVDGEGSTGLNFISPVTGKRITDDELRQIVSAADPEVLEASREFQKFNDKMVEMAIQTGLIPRALGERFKTLMYTPMYRYQEEQLKANPNITLGGGIYEAVKDPDGITAFNKTLSAGGAVHGDLYENMLRNYNAIVSAAVRNVAYKETADTLTKLMKDGGDTTIAENVDKPADGTINYRVAGEDRYMVIHDPTMFQAISALSPAEKNAFTRAASKFTGILRTGITATPPFQLRNTIRGLVELKIKTGMPVFELLRGFMGGVKDTWSKGDAYQSIVAQTGFGGFGFGSGYKDQASYMKRVYLSREKPLDAWNGFLRAFDKMETIGEVTEMAPRIAYYNYLKRRGMPDADAAWEAVNLVNYHRHGTGNGVVGNVISNLIPLTPFLTARIQGLYRLFETGTEGAPKSLVGKGVIGIPAAIVTRGLMVAVINAGLNAMYGDEDWYKQLSVKDRLANMYIKVGDTVIALPRAYEVGELFGGLPTLMLDSIRKENGNDIASGVAEMMKKTFLLEPVPQVVKPIAELVANKNFYTGQPIENLSDKRSPKEERFDEYTTSVAKLAGQLAPVTGLSPKQVDTLIRGYLGTASTLFLGTVDSLASTGGTRPQGAFGDPTSIGGVVGNLTGLTSILKTESQLNNKFVGDFYEIKQKVTEIVQSMNDAASRGDIETVKARMEQMPQARALYTTFNATGARLSEINKQMDVIRNNPTFTPDRKTELLEKLRKAKGDLSQQLVNAAEKVGVTR